MLRLCCKVMYFKVKLVSCSSIGFNGCSISLTTVKVLKHFVAANTTKWLYIDVITLFSGQPNKCYLYNNTSPKATTY